MKKILFALCMVLWSVRPGASQVLYGTIVGTIEDAAGALVPGALATANSPASGQSRQTRSNEAGVFRFTDLPPGIYDVSVSARGFRRFALDWLCHTAIPRRCA